MRNEENSTQVFSSEQLKTVQDMIGETEPSLFSVLQELSKKYDEKTTIFLTKEFCLNCQTHENQRVGMEFLYMNGFHRELEGLIEINKASSNQINIDWGNVYEFILDRKKNRKYKGEVFNFANNYHTNDRTLSCLLIFLKIYGHIDVYEYELLDEYQEELTSMLLDIDNTLIRIYFQLRENEVLFHYHWTKNEVEVARKYAFNIVDNIFNQDKKCFMHIWLGNTYIFDDYERSLEHLEKAEKIAIDYDLDHFLYAIKNNVLPFISAYNGVYENITTKDIAEQAHLEIARGDKSKAVEILRGLHDLTPFQEYYLGIALDDCHILNKSYLRFINERKDHFFARLPYLELVKRGWDFDEENNYAN